MPFQRYAKGISFRPESVAVLSEALATTTEVLGITPDQQGKRELIAKLIVQAALEDQTLDAVGLSRKAIASFWKSRRTLSE
jgi:hypothetical protein